MKLVLDAGAFFIDIAFSGEIFTVPGVVEELRDLRAKCRFDLLEQQGLRVVQPGDRTLAEVKDAVRRTGDQGVLSPADESVLALALEIGGDICTDDFAVQNVAKEMGIEVHPIQQRRAVKVQWRYRCAGCGRYYREPGECPVCGAQIKRKLK
jgi:UPF0271 protein